MADKKEETKRTSTKTSTAKKDTTTKATTKKSTITKATTKKSTTPKTTTKKVVTKSTTKKTSNKSETKANNKSTTSKKSSKGKTTKSASNNDTKKIEKAKQTKKAKKTDEKIKQIIAEQLENVDKVEEIKEVPVKEKKKKVETLDKEKISQQIEEASKMPKDKKRGIYKNMFMNILIGIFVILYFVSLGVGFINIESVAYVTDLKVFSIAILAIAIILFEYSYNKDCGKFAIIGIEMLCVAIVTLVLLYMYILYNEKYLLITSIASCIAVIYYLVKSISIYIRDKSNWKKTVSDIKEIVSEE